MWISCLYLCEKVCIQCCRPCHAWVTDSSTKAIYHFKLLPYKKAQATAIWLYQKIRGTDWIQPHISIEWRTFFPATLCPQVSSSVSEHISLVIKAMPPEQLDNCYEKNISTQCTQTQAHTRLSFTYGNQRWPSCVKPPSCQRSQAPGSLSVAIPSEHNYGWCWIQRQFR